MRMLTPKRFASLTVGLGALVFMLTLTACGGGSDSNETQAVSGVEPSAKSDSNETQTVSSIEPSTKDVEAVTSPPTRRGLSEPLHPCGPSLMPSKGGLQEHFLHWTQEGSHLVFNDDDTIWVLDLESGDLRQVADVDLNYERLVDPPRSSIRFMYGFHADVSPDGSHIVYSTCEYPDDRLIETWKGTGNTEPHYEGLEAYELGTVDIKGNGRKRLTKAAGLVNHPSWSPDGKQIAFVAQIRDSGSMTLDRYHYPYYARYRKDVKIALIAADESESPEGEFRRIGGTGRVALYPRVWSPDGQRLAYLAYSGEEYPFDIVLYTVGLDGLDLTRIRQASAPATWSPNSEELAFASLDGEAPIIYAVRPDGTRLRTIWRGEPGNDATSISQVSWSPGGTELLFVYGAVYIVRPDGDGLSCLVPGRAATRAAWSPDGSRIVVRHLGGEIITSPDGSRIAVRHSGNEIIMMSRDGTALRTLAIGEDDGRLHLSDLPPQTTGEAGCP